MHQAHSLEEVLAYIRSAGFNKVELCGLDSAWARQWEAIADETGIEATSVHAPCPDDVVSGLRIPGDWILDDDADRRRSAIAAVIDTVAFAKNCNIDRIVLHLGTLGLQELYKNLVRSWNAGTNISFALSQYQSEREREAIRRRGRLMEALDAILSASDGIKIGIENRYRYDQVPNIEDAIFLLDHYPEGSGLYYWHDTGHEAAQRNFRLWPETIPEALVQRLVGMHIHDCDGLNDHLAPGEGSYEFSSLKPLTTHGIPLVLELQPEIDLDRIRAGRAKLVTSLNGDKGK